MNEEIKEQKTECDTEFLKISNFYKCILYGIITILGLLGGSVLWAMGVEAVSSKHNTQIISLDTRITKVETKLDGIDNKLDIIISKVK